MKTMSEQRETLGFALLVALVAAFALAMSGCATVPTPTEIAVALDRRLTMLADWPLSVRCQAVRDAVARCEAAGLPSDCAWDGWHDQDRDAWTIAACRRRAP